jgi:hypothetical protein
MSTAITLKRVLLTDRHLQPGRTRHTINGADFQPFVSLEIVQYPNETSCYLFHIAADGNIADTWHESIEDALQQAEFEFGVQACEWTDVSRPSGQLT